MKVRGRMLAIVTGSLILSVCAPQKMQAREAPELYARSAVLMDGDSGRILYAREADTPMPMASTTKIMTCIVALEAVPEDTVCTVTENASSQPKVRLGMTKGDAFYLKDLLYSLMLESHNDAAVCIAETVGGSTEKFAERMNQKAEEIGCEDTYFITPNGLDAADGRGEHHTTARELAMVMRYCLTQSEKAGEFLEITRTPSYTFTNVKGSRSYTCTNHNALLSILDGAVSGKTGFTGKAGYCYVGAVKRGDSLLIVSLLACGWPNNKGYKWVDTKKLVKYAEEHFQKRRLVQEPYRTGPVHVTGGKSQSVDTYVKYGEALEETERVKIKEQDMKNKTAKKQAVETVLMRPDESVETQGYLVKELRAPVKKGEEVGSVSYLVDGVVYARYPVVAKASVPVWNYKTCLLELAEKLLFCR